MPPNLQKTLRASWIPVSSITRTGPSFLPFLYPQQRSASILSNLSDNAGAYNRKIRRGRGPSSGKGKTSGRGHKGQKARGKVPRGFNGGQTPNEVVHGVRGFENQFSIELQPLNLEKVQSWVDQGRLNPSQPITIRELAISRCVYPVKDGFKLLAKGSDKITLPLHIVASRASASAIAAVEAAGGSVTTRYYTPQSIKRIIKGMTDPIHSMQSQIVIPVEEPGEKKEYPVRLPDPTSRKDIEYYRDPAHRGYLSHHLEEGQGPSLFFKTPGVGNSVARKKRSKGTSATDNHVCHSYNLHSLVSHSTIKNPLTMSKDSSHTYIHFSHPRIADLFEEYTRPPHLPPEPIYVPPQHQPPNPEDEDDVVPDQHAAFGIQRATQPKREVAWRDLGLEALMEKGPSGRLPR
ncbi:MAG: hypothetical protein Q9182_003479 [Xanthomendoza sp. 2 TL-2023]